MTDVVGTQSEPGGREPAPAAKQVEVGVPSTSERARRTKAQLLAAAQRVFVRDGYLNARVADIAAEAGGRTAVSTHIFVQDRCLPGGHAERPR